MDREDLIIAMSFLKYPFGHDRDVFTSEGLPFSYGDNMRTDTAIELFLTFVDESEESNKLLKKYIGDNPQLMGSALRVLHDELEQEINKYDSAQIPESLSETIKTLDNFVDDYTSKLKRDKSIYFAGSIACLPISILCIIYSLKNSTTLDIPTIVIPIALSVGLYSSLKARKVLPAYYDFKSAYNEK